MNKRTPVLNLAPADARGVVQAAALRQLVGQQTGVSTKPKPKPFKTTAPHLSEFIQSAWHVVEPATTFVPGWHLDAIAEHLEAVTAGDIHSLLINMPPRHMKSLAVSVFWPCWEWIEHPERRWLFASYAQSLSTRDSLKCRRLIESPWYQGLWGDRFQLTGDQNAKTRFENTKTGYRLATSVGGSATGEGGDRVVCFPWGALIMTDRGELPIGEIVDQQLAVRILGPSGRWQPIAAYERNPGRPLLELQLENGTALRCTEDHQLYVDMSGWQRARDVIQLPYDNVHLRSLRQRVSACSSPCSPERYGAVLFSGVLRQEGARPGQSCMEGRPGYTDLPCLPERVSVKAIGSAAPEVLFLRMRHSLSQSAEVEALRYLREIVCGNAADAAILQSWMRQCGTSFSDSRRGEWELQDRGMADPLHGGIPAILAAADSQARWEPLRSLRFNNSVASASHRRNEDQPRSGEPGHPLQVVPSDGTYEDWHQPGLDEPVRVQSVRSIEAPAYVYNLRVDEDHAYYADGVLVHNCDDPHNVNDANSAAIREATLTWWDQTMSSRLNDPKTGSRVIVMQRVHERDLSGHVLETGGWEHLSLPAEYEGAGPSRHHTGIGWSDPRTMAGELLWPERFGAPELAKLKRELGSYAAAGQLQQRPSPAEGGIFKRDWWRFWGYETTVARPGETVYLLPAKFDEVLQSWDMAFKDKASSDFVAGGVWARKGADRFLLDQVHDRLSFTATLRAVRNLSADWPEAKAKLVEDKANGTAVIDTLRHEVSGLIPIEPEGGKESRAHAVTAQVEAGNVYLPHPSIAPWVEDFIEECAAFPKGAYDDQVDQMTQALNRFANGPQPPSTDFAFGSVERSSPWQGVRSR